MRDGEVDIIQVNASRMTDEAVDALRQAVDQTEGARLLLDLAGVSYIASYGISGLVHVRRAATERKARLVLTGLQPFVVETLTATRILTVFEVFPDRDAGLSELRKST
jgi:anti-anti-sigma factor